MMFYYKIKKLNFEKMKQYFHCEILKSKDGDEYVATPFAPYSIISFFHDDILEISKEDFESIN